MAGTAPIRAAYAALGIAITPALRLWLKRRAKRGKEDAARMGERFGHAALPRPAGRVVWLHAASVGETQSILALMRSLLDAHPAIHLLITTGTVTSAALVAQQHLPRTIHQFIPVDTAPAVARFLQHWQPDLALWIESELWPQLVWQTQAREVPMLLINARLSARSLRSWQRWPATIQSLLHGFTAIYAGSDDDAARLTALGARDVKNIGNLKYDAATLPIDETLIAELNAAGADRRIVVAASTHANEEQQIAEAHAIVAQAFPTLLTIIVPRHASRGDTIAADLRAQNISVAQRSKHEPITPTTAMYLADTMGELGSFYRVAELVFIGGSLVAHGGQNPLEPARLGNALLSGPHTHNFAAIMQHVQQAGGLRIVADKAALAIAIRELLGDDAARRTLATNARATVENARGASAIIARECSALLQGSTP
ncbi:MAG: 3-deoxy-D-manno-octulosonic acid transferase [Pseudomonadota bacterium]